LSILIILGEVFSFSFVSVLFVVASIILDAMLLGSGDVGVAVTGDSEGVSVVVGEVGVVADVSEV
jgi:hypothetical protein